ncbi:MAG TPA: hypothetical protein VGP72_07005 [Planctomycetota bacterium]|jgi:hypothetical protein
MTDPRHCEDCRQISLDGHEERCSACGGRLTEITAPPGRHPIIVTAVLSFSIGLIVLHTVLPLLGAHLIPSLPAYSSVLGQLQMLGAGATVLYLILRRSEGDFHALLLTSLLLLAGTECLSALARGYGLLSLTRLAGVLNMGLFVYSSLALTAGAADSGSHRPHSRRLCLLAASTGMLLLASLRVFLQVRRRDDEASHWLLTLVLGGVALLVGGILVFEELRRRRTAGGRTQEAGGRINGTDAEKFNSPSSSSPERVPQTTPSTPAPQKE